MEFPKFGGDYVNQCSINVTNFFLHDNTAPDSKVIGLGLFMSWNMKLKCIFEYLAQELFNMQQD